MSQRRRQTGDRHVIAIRSCWLKGRDDSAMTEDDTGWGVPPEVAQLRDGLASQPPARLVQRGGRHRRPVPGGRPIRRRHSARLTYLIAVSCLAGSLVSAGLAVAEIANYPHGAGNLDILGVITGLLGGAAALVDDWKPRGWASRINTLAAWLGFISAFILMNYLGTRHGWSWAPGSG